MKKKQQQLTFPLSRGFYRVNERYLNEYGHVIYHYKEKHMTPDELFKTNHPNIQTVWLPNKLIFILDVESNGSGDTLIHYLSEVGYGYTTIIKALLSDLLVRIDD